MHLRRVLMLLLVLAVLELASSRDLVIRHNKLFLNGTEFLIKGVNYSPTPLGIATMDGGGWGGGGYCSPKMTSWGEWKSACYDSDYFDGSPDNTGYPPRPSDGFAALWRRDFPLIKAMGANVVRIYNANPTTKQMSQMYPMFLHPQGKDHVPFLDYAQQNGLYVMFPLYSDMWAFNNNREEDFKRFLRAQIDEVGNHSAVLIWQFGNEMNWDRATMTLGFYQNSALMAKYNNYAQYIRQYTLAKWGRVIPITHAVIDYPSTFDWLLQEFDNDIFSLNTFRGTSTTDLFTGNSNTAGFTYGTCAWGKPLLISEFGWPSYTANWANQLISNFVSHLNHSLVGMVVFEHNDEPVPQKPADQQHFGAFAVTKTVNGTQDSTQPNVYMIDTMTPKQLRHDLAGGKFNNKEYNYFGNLYALAGRSAQRLANSVDYCASVGTFTNCSGGYPACSGHGLCDRRTGTCKCAPGWAGIGCASPICDCTGRGTCNILTSPPQCICNAGFYGPKCESTLQAQRTSCPNGCTGTEVLRNGVCNSNFECECVPGWTGLDCSIVDIPNPFPGLNINPNPPPVIETEQVCKVVTEGQTLSLSCSLPSYLISSVQFASYGTPTGSCRSFTKGPCHSSTSTSIVLARCVNKNTCSFVVNNDAFGDPCHGTLKRLHVQAICSPAQATERLCKSVNENQILTLACSTPTMNITSIQFASYGTPDGSCGAFTTGTCHASTSLSVAQSRCLNQNSCSFKIENTPFGDPCFITLKHFNIQATCSRL